MYSDVEKEIELMKRSLRSAIATTRGLRTIDVELEGPDNTVVINRKKGSTPQNETFVQNYHCRVV